MALKFNCPQCNATLFSRQLHQGELAECTQCGARFAARAAIPAADQVAGKTVDRAEPDVTTSSPSGYQGVDQDPRVPCPRCATHCDQGTEVCPACNLRFSEISLYNPKRFVWLSLLMSFLVPLYLSAVNYGRLGQRRKKNLTLTLGIGAFIMVLAGIVHLDQILSIDSSEAAGASRAFSRLVSLVVNWPAALILKSRQDTLFKRAMGVGMKQASLWKGVFKGIGITAAVVIPVILILIVFFIDDPEGRAIELMEDEQYTAAVTLLDSLHTEYPDDVDLLYHRGRSLLGCCRYTEAEADLTAFLKERPDNAHAHLLVSLLLFRKGLGKEAMVHLAKADSLEPGIAKRYVESKQGR